MAPMMKWIKRIHGAIGIGLTWAAGWVPIGAMTGWVTATVLGFPRGVVTANYAVLFGVLGFVGGTIFSTVLSLAEGRRSFNQLSLPRFAAWGGLGGLLLGVFAVTAGILGAGLTALGVVITVAATLLGAGSAAATLVLANAAQSRALLPAGDAIARVEPTEDNARLGNVE